MKKLFTTVMLCFTFTFIIHAQMYVGVDTLYGNEWIDYDLPHYKVMVAENGIYRLSYQDLINKGIAANNIDGTNYRLYHMGEEIPIHVSSNNAFGANDYIEFFGKKNQSELDEFLYNFPETDLLNPEYSLFTDSSAYFLTWEAGSSNNLRMTEVDNDLSNPPSAESYYWEDQTEVFKDKMIKQVFQSSTYNSYFDVAEGFSTGFNNALAAFTVTPNNALTSGPNAEMTIRWAGGTGAHEHHVRANGTEYAVEVFNNFAVRQKSFNIPSSELNEPVEVEIEGVTGSTDKPAVAYIKLEYPKSFDFQNSSSFEFNLKSGGVKYLNISNFNTSGTPVLYDVTNNIRIEGTVQSGNVQIVIPGSVMDRKLLLINESSGAKPVSYFENANFIDFDQAPGEFLIVSNNRLYGSSVNWVQEYADYRSTVQGGEFAAKVYEVQQLYDQFAYGVNRHCISIRNFVNYAHRFWPNPRYVFLLGKAIEYDDVRLADDVSNIPFFVPTYGFPGADNLFGTANLAKSSVIPIGRLAASSSNDVRIYLDKVIAHEANFNLPQTFTDRSWMKRIIHLGGGNTEIQGAIKGYLKSFEFIAENGAFGGEVSSFYKTSADPIQISQSEALRNLINTGVSMLTFYGHSSAGTFDYNLDNPANYENEGRYPVILSLGCYSGQIHADGPPGISQNFVLQESRGSIAFFASTGPGYITQLFEFGKAYYNEMSENSYGQGIGDIMQNGFRANGNSMGDLVHQMTLHGDPAIRINPHPGQDFIVDEASIQIEPSQVNIRQDSFSLEFDVVNLGQFQLDTITLQVLQRFPNGDEEVIISEQMETPRFVEHFEYKIPTFGNQSLGPNSFIFNIDLNDDALELPDPNAEMNNQIIYSPVYFVSNDVTPVVPNEFSIVNDPNITLKASTTDAFIQSQKYIFEIDTTASFSSNVKERFEMQSNGGVIEWDPNLNFQDNTVYYWRVSPDSTQADIGYIWKESSFIYMPQSSEGWNQSHYFQFRKDYFANIELEGSRKFEFIDDVKDFLAQNPLNQTPNRTQFSINGQRQDKYRLKPDAGVLVAVLDSLYIEPWDNPIGGPYSITNRVTNLFAFPTWEPEERKNLMDFLTDSIPSGNMVLMMSVLEPGYSFEPEEWASDSDIYGTNIFEILEAQGASQVRELETVGSLPYIFLYQKDRMPLGEKRAQDLEELLDLTYAFDANWDRGFLESTLIGPASEWQSLSWEYSSENNPESDYASVSVYGVEESGQSVLLHDNIVDFDTTLNHIDAEIYPYLRLQYNALDTVWLSCPQLDFWRINYKGLPEVAINPNILFSFESDSLQQGETVMLDIAIENIGSYDMDSLLVKYSITDLENNELSYYDRLAPLAAGQNLKASFAQDTRNLGGINRLVVEVNPDNDQPEQFHFNNVGVKDFYINEDNRNPLLDVTFDGFHIMDGDIVSSKPEILISLKDENPHLILDDTSLFKVFIQYPDQNVASQYYVDNDILTFYPADAGGVNKAQLVFKPNFAVDGIYTLIVQAEDKTGNESGAVDYKISFEVISKQSISNVLNYPNPFSTSTKFVFTLTGDEIPERMKIQIMTVSGRVVKEITQDDLGPIHVGHNITDYSWDGTDEYGTKLANGVYLYRVVTQKADGTSYEKYNTSANKFFKRDLGKLVILR